MSRGPRDPAYGMWYNKVEPSHYLSSSQYQFDIARTPSIVRDIGDRANVQDEVWAANSKRRKIDKKLGRVTKGIY